MLVSLGVKIIEINEEFPFATIFCGGGGSSPVFWERKMGNPWDDSVLAEHLEEKQKSDRLAWRHTNPDLSDEDKAKSKQKSDEFAVKYKKRLAELFSLRPLSLVSVHDCECATTRRDMESNFEDAFKLVPESAGPVHVCSLDIWVVLAFEGVDEFLNNEHFDQGAEIPSDTIKRMTEQGGCGSFESFGTASDVFEAMEVLDDRDFWQED